MFPGGNSNADLGYNKLNINQYVAPAPHFIPANAAAVSSGAAMAMPLNIQGSIDWAQLAQQWIHMRDSGGAPATPATVPQLSNFAMTTPIAPPPPIIGNTPLYNQHEMKPQKSHYEEKGEADMDMDEDNERGHGAQTPPPLPNITQSQWLKGSSGNNVAEASGTQQWNLWSGRSNINVAAPANPTAHIPSLLKLNVSNPNHNEQQRHQSVSVADNGTNASAVSGIDASKRKMLPAWIREGLEKMEREKQRQQERHHDNKSPTSPAPAPAQQQAVNVKQVSSKTLTSVNLLNNSNLASDSEDSNAAAAAAAAADDDGMVAQQQQRVTLGNDVLCSDQEEEEEEDNAEYGAADNADAAPVHDEAGNADADAAKTVKNYEEKLADLMLVVRRTLTEILLETTNEEIAAVCKQETLKAQRAQASSAQVIRKSAFLSSITGNLGLAAYGDSSSESEDEEDQPEPATQRINDEAATQELDNSIELSIDELKARVRKSKRTFERIIDDIEQRVAQQQESDEHRLQLHRKLELAQLESASKRRRHAGNSEPSSDTSKSSAAAAGDHKLQHFNGKRLSRKERTTRFSDNKDGKQCATSSYVSQLQQQAAAAAAAATATVSASTACTQKLQPVPNPATALLQMPESVASMLNAADKALDKASKSDKKLKRKHSRKQASSSSSSTSTSSGSSSGSSNSNGSSSSSSSSDSSSSSSGGGSARAKNRSKDSRHGSFVSRSQPASSSSRRQLAERESYDRHSRRKYERHYSSRERERERYESQRRRARRDSSGSDNGRNRRSSRHSRSSSGYRRQRQRTRSRSVSPASTHRRKRH